MSYFAGAYWGQRQESRRECAVRLHMLIQALQALDPSFMSWYKKVASRKATPVEIPPDLGEVESNLKVSRRDIGGEPIVDIGFNFSAWTGKGDVSTSLSATCGAYSPFIRNSVVLSFESSGRLADSLFQDILMVLIEVFEPEHAVVSSTELLLESPSLPPWEAPAIFCYKKDTGFIRN